MEPGVLENDSDADEDGLTAILDSSVSYGELNLQSDGSFDYRPTLGYFGNDTFSYHANDGVLDALTVLVTVTVEKKLQWYLYLPVVLK